MPTFQLDFDQLESGTDQRAVFAIKGKLSLETVSEFVQKMRPQPAAHLVLDMSGVTFLDSAGVGSLVSLFVNRRNGSRTLALAALSPQSTAVVTVAGLQKLLPIYKTLDEALTAA